MSGWLILAVLALATLAGLWWRLRRRNLIELVGAAMLLGIAGYAWQGAPGLPGRPTKPRANQAPPPSGFADERRAWLPQVGSAARTLNAAEGMSRNMGPEYGLGLMRGAVAQAPNDAMLWMGLGNALAAYADGSVTPAARFAYERAAALAPNSPAPAYFLALAYAESGDLDSAGKMWRGLLDAAPVDAPWRAQIEQKLAIIDAARLQN